MEYMEQERKFLIQKKVFNFNALPFELLVKIFTYLRHNYRLKMALVCQRWFDAARRSPKFSKSLRKIDDASDLRVFIETFKGDSMSFPIKSIRLYSWKKLEELLPTELHEFNEIFKKNSDADIQFLNPCRIAKPNDFQVIKKIDKNNVRILKLRFKQSASDYVPIQNCMEYLSDFEKLEELFLYYGSPEHKITFSQKVLSFPKLKQINIIAFGELDIKFFDKESFRRLLASCPNLLGFHTVIHNEKRADSLHLIQTICQECPLLKKLSIVDSFYGFEPMDDLDQFPQSIVFLDDFIEDVKGLKNLEELLMPSYCIKSFTIFEKIQFNKIKRLECIFHKLTKENAQILVEAFPNVRYLDLMACTNGPQETNLISEECIKVFTQLKPYI